MEETTDTAKETATASSIDVADADFDRAVIEESRTRPVAVDFWAPWCAPCRTLGPILDRVISEQGGAVLLAKVDIDQCPTTAARYGVRSVPTVTGFRAGAVVASFVGLQPESAVRSFVAQLVPSPADRLLSEAIEFSEAGHHDAAEQRLRQAIELAPRHGGAWLALARLLAETNDPDGALAALDEIDLTQAERPDADRLAAELRVRGGTGGDLPGAVSIEELAGRVAAMPSAVGARVELGSALAAAGRDEEALDALLEAIRLDPDFDGGAARLRFVDLLDVLGPEHELTSAYRRRLAGVLYR